MTGDRRSAPDRRRLCLSATVAGAREIWSSPTSKANVSTPKNWSERISPHSAPPGTKPGDLSRVSCVGMWLPSNDTSRTLLPLFLPESRRTISRYRALVKSAKFAQPSGSDEFLRDSVFYLKASTGGVRKRDRDRAIRIRAEGGPRPSLRERAVALAKQKGEVRAKDLTAIGVPRCYLTPMCEEGLLTKVGYGRYRVPLSKGD